MIHKSPQWPARSHVAGNTRRHQKILQLEMASSAYIHLHVVLRLVTWRSSRWLTEHSQRLWLLGLEGRLAHNRLQSASISHYCNRMQVFVQCHNMPRVSCLTRCKCVGFKSTYNAYLFGFTYLIFYGVRFQQALPHINQGKKTQNRKQFVHRFADWGFGLEGNGSWWRRAIAVFHGCLHQLRKQRPKMHATILYNLWRKRYEKICRFEWVILTIRPSSK